MPDAALTQGLDVKRPLPLIFDKVGDVEAGRSGDCSTRSARVWKTGTSNSNARHGNDKE